jgi:hypothetical protein
MEPRRTVRAGRVWVALLVVAAFGVAMVGGVSASGTVTIGQTGTPELVSCDGDAYQFQTAVTSGTPYEVPVGTWTLTDWSTKAWAGSIQLAVFRPIGSGDYEVVGLSAVEVLPGTGGAVSTFPASIAVQGGDLLGFYIPAEGNPFGIADCADFTLENGDTHFAEEAGGSLATGQDVTPSPSFTGIRLSVSATLIQAADTTAPTTTVDLDPLTPDGQSGWYASDVTVAVAATDDAGGSGVAETRCVLDPSSPPLTLDDIPAGCAYTGAGTDVTTDGMYTVYAASVDTDGNKETPASASFKIDQTNPTLSPAVSPNPVVLGGSASATAGAGDAISGLDSSSCGAVDTATVGVKSVACEAADSAGNSNSANTPYTVKYLLSLSSPFPKSSYKGGAMIPVKFTLANQAGVKISDADAQALLSPTCRVKVTFDGVEQPGCAGYDPTLDMLKYELKTSKTVGAGAHSVVIKVGAPDGSGVVNTDSTIVNIKS